MRNKAHINDLKCAVYTLTLHMHCMNRMLAFYGMALTKQLHFDNSPALIHKLAFYILLLFYITVPHITERNFKAHMYSIVQVQCLLDDE